MGSGGVCGGGRGSEGGVGGEGEGEGRGEKGREKRVGKREENAAKITSSDIEHLGDERI